MMLSVQGLEQCKCCHEKWNKRIKAVAQCKECRVAFCESCAQTHKNGKVASSHTLILIRSPAETSGMTKTACDYCKNIDKEAFCTTCNLFLCNICLRQHKKEHSSKKNKESSSTLSLCSKCKSYGALYVADKICFGCGQYLCKECFNSHRCKNFTGRTGVGSDLPTCEPCELVSVVTTAKVICLDCDELLCRTCGEQHEYSFDLHKIRSLQYPGKTIKNINLCEPCYKSGKEEHATSVCANCENKLFCDGCAVQHVTFKLTKLHKVTSIASSPKFTDQKETQTESIDRADKVTNTFPNEDSLSILEHAPGKPKASYIGIDSITLVWNKAEEFENTSYYQVSYQETDNHKRWKIYDDDLQLKVSNLTVSHLKTNTAYRFRVRVLNEVGEGPYSPPSDKIITRTSSAGMLMSFSKKVRDGNPSPAIYALPVTENKDFRNDKAKTRWCEIGISTRGSSSTDKTIMLFGTSGCGKRNLIDNMINYSLGVQWTDSFRFTTKSEEINAGFINIFAVSPEQGSRLQYRLKIIDIPSFHSSKPLDKNLEILEQVRVLLSDAMPTGLDYLDAVCFVVRSTDRDLSKFQESIFQQVLSLFGKDLNQNIFTMFSFADCKEPPILKFILKSKMPFQRTVSFNTSALFLNNVGLGAKPTLQMYWNASEESFDNFFQYLNKTRIQSLEQTKHVLQQESLLKANFKKVQSEFDHILRLVNELRKEQDKIEQEENRVKSNENFRTVTDKITSVSTELPSGKYAINCQQCNFTCCPSVDSPNINIESCDTMDSTGKCKACDGNCEDKAHAIESNIYTLSTEKVSLVDKIKMEAFNDANTELQRIEVRVQTLSSQLNTLCDTLLKEADTLTNCRDQIAQHSLWPHAQALKTEIDINIELLKEEKQEGFIDKIRKLKEFRKYVEITNEAQQFVEDARSILQVVGRNRQENVAADSNFEKLVALLKSLQ